MQRFLPTEPVAVEVAEGRSTGPHRRRDRPSVEDARVALRLRKMGAAWMAALALLGCGTPVEPSPGLDLQLSLNEGIRVVGETPDHAELRMEVHRLANRRYLGLKWGPFARHALADGDLELTAGELAALMTEAGADPSDLPVLREVRTLSGLVRLLEGSHSAEERRHAWAAFLVEREDADGSGGLSYGEFRPLLDVPKRP